mmetsp:Transcript_50144/g.121501  ORF Transcript_50144/g.121501 Transcript_50144/m.121501 type:complete len:91 (-) Transcript_50144:1038-1310(-)
MISFHLLAIRTLQQTNQRRIFLFLTGCKLSIDAGLYFYHQFDSRTVDDELSIVSDKVQILDDVSSIHQWQAVLEWHQSGRLLTSKLKHGT